jgi:hypothetical protein
MENTEMKGSISGESRKILDTVALVLGKYHQAKLLIKELREPPAVVAREEGVSSDEVIRLRLLIATIARDLYDDGYDLREDALLECSMFAHRVIDSVKSRDNGCC